MNHRRRGAGEAQGANWGVIFTALRELMRLRAELTALDSRHL